MSKIAFLFPGQGAQKAGMGQDFYEKYPSARQVFDQASQWLSLDMKALCFEKNDRLNLTEYTQAALVTTCLAMEKVVEECGLHPDINCRIKPWRVLCHCCFRWNECERCHSNCAKKRNPYGTRSAGRRRLYGSCYRS